MKDFDKKKEGIIETAGQLFNQLGYDNTSMGKIAVAIGSGKASLYYYFKSKEELFLSVMEREGCKYMEELNKSSDDQIDTVTRLRYFLMIPIQLYERHSEMVIKIFLKIVKIRLKRVQQLANEMLQGFFKVFRELLEEGKADGSFKEDLDIERFMIVMLNCINSLFYHEIPGVEIINNKEDMRINYEFLIDTMLEGIKKIRKEI